MNKETEKVRETKPGAISEQSNYWCCGECHPWRCRDCGAYHCDWFHPRCPQTGERHEDKMHRPVLVPIGALNTESPAVMEKPEDEAESKAGASTMSDTSFRAQTTNHPSGLATMPNEHPEVVTRMEHPMELPRCCPVSGNPLPGSLVTIRYRVGERVLEVYALRAYIDAFRGGHPDGTRNMEAMIQKIARDCAEALGVLVFVHAHLHLAPYQEMRISVTAHPDGATQGHAQGRLNPPQ
jgi:NADPH-dependent 7-cyano-7-deazaguanine reductase QueF